MKVITGSWNNKTDKTKVKFTEYFAGEDWIVKLDVLSDLIKELQDHYNEILNLDWEQRKKHNFNKLENNDAM